MWRPKEDRKALHFINNLVLTISAAILLTSIIGELGASSHMYSSFKSPAYITIFGEQDYKYSLGRALVIIFEMLALIFGLTTSFTFYSLSVFVVLYITSSILFFVGLERFDQKYLSQVFDKLLDRDNRNASINLIQYYSSCYSFRGDERQCDETTNSTVNRCCEVVVEYFIDTCFSIPLHYILIFSTIGIISFFTIFIIAYGYCDHTVLMSFRRQNS